MMKMNAKATRMLLSGILAALMLSAAVRLGWRQINNTEKTRHLRQR
jgi:formate/nitrite transporter FocA (FNT family)